MKKTRKEVVSGIKFWVIFAFTIVLALATMYLEMTTDYEWADFRQPLWWALFAVRVVLFVILYLDTYDYVYPAILADEYGITHNQIQILMLRVDRIKREHLYPELDDAVTKRNDVKFREEANALIAGISSRITYEDIEKDYSVPGAENERTYSGWDALGEKEVNDIIISRCGMVESSYMSRKQVRQMRKRKKEFAAILTAIKAGDVYVDRISPDDVMNKAFMDGIKKDLTGKNINGDIARGHTTSIVRGIIGIFFSMALTIFSIAMDGVVQGILTTVAIILSAAGSGLVRAKIIENKTLHICQANNDFFLMYMGISDTVAIPERKKKQTPGKTIPPEKPTYIPEENMIEVDPLGDLEL